MALKALGCVTATTGLLVGLGAVSAGAASAAPVRASDTATFTSSVVGSSGTTAQFTQTGNWQMAWSYDCSSASGGSGNFDIGVNEPANDIASDLAPAESGTSGSGTDYYYDTGTFSLSVLSNCQWSITVSAYGAGPAGGTASYSNAQTGSTGQTSQFTESGNWQIKWSYNCAPSVGTNGGIGISLNQPANDTAPDLGAYSAGTSGSGTDYYYDTGTFSLAILSYCQWAITVSPSGASPADGTASYSSSLSGMTGQTSQFTESGNWQMVWSYTCPSSGSSGGSNPNLFDVLVNEPAGDTAADQAPTESGTSGSGTDDYTDAGTFSLEMLSDCNWSITVSPQGAGPTPPPPPPPSSGPHCNTTLPSGSVVGMAVTADGNGYWIASSTGQVAACGDAPVLGSGSPGTAAIASAPTGDGYWLVTQSGAVDAFGSAVYHGGLAPTVHLAKPIVAMAADPATGGYWLLGGDGGVFSYDAPFYGSTGNIHLTQPAVGLEATLDGKGYRFVASDGGIFDYGDARFYGSTGGVKLNKPVVGMADDPATGGYWLDASDGGIFSFNAPFHGSTGNVRLAQPCVGMTAMPNGAGYRFVAADGGIFDFGNAPFEGSAA